MNESEREIAVTIEIIFIHEFEKLHPLSFPFPTASDLKTKIEYLPSWCVQPFVSILILILVLYPTDCPFVPFAHPFVRSVV